MDELNDSPSRGGFSLEVLRTPLAALGIFGVLAGLAVWLVQGEFDLVARVLTAGGILLLGIFVALDPDDVWQRITGRGALYSGNTLLIALAVVGILGLVNVIGNRYQAKYDATANKQFTLSDQSIQIAQSLQEPVKVFAFLQGQDPGRSDFQALLNDYANRSGGQITYEIIDPDLRPSDAIQMGVREYGTIVYQMGEKRQNSTGTQERDITTALLKLTRPAKKLYFVTGHGERRIDGSEQGDYGQLRQILERDNFTPEALNLATQRAVPDDAAAVVVAGPTTPFLPEEKDALRAYLQGGGKLMLLLDPGSQAAFNDLLEAYGVGFNNNLVVEQPGRSLQGDVRVPVADRFPQHAITRELRNFVIFPATNSISLPAPGGGVTVTSLADSSDRSFGESNLQQIQQDPTDPVGPLSMAAAIEAPVSGVENRKTRIVLFGTSNLVSNTFVNLPVGNGDLFVNAANWLAEQEDLISIRPRPADQRSMVLTGTQLNLIVYSSMLFLPLAVLAAGAAIWWTRR